MLTFDEAQNTLLMSAIDGNLDTVAMNYEMLRPLIATFSMNRELALRTLAIFNVDKVNIMAKQPLSRQLKRETAKPCRYCSRAMQTLVLQISRAIQLSHMRYLVDNMRLQTYL